MDSDNGKEISCGIVVFRKNRSKRLYLVIHDLRNGKWGFPRGHQDKGESDLQTAKRETYEETGLRPRTISGFLEHTDFVNHLNIERRVKFFVGEATNPDIKMQKGEITEYKWLEYPDALKRVHPRFKGVLKKAHEFLELRDKKIKKLVK